MLCLNGERALRMIALAGNFYIFAPCLTAHLATVLLAVRNTTEARNVCTFLVLLVHHGKSSDRYCFELSIPKGAGPDDDLLHRFLIPALVNLIPDSFLFRREFDAIGLFGSIAINQTCKIIRVDRIR